MKARPILFSTPMIRALLDGCKQQTRRIIKPQPDEGYSQQYEDNKPTQRTSYGWSFQKSPKAVHVPFPSPQALKFCPYGRPGDLLWVRENLWVRRDDPTEYAYVATDDVSYEGVVEWKRRPSIHMPRTASRITLEITDVRVQRLKEISNDDALAEGVLDGFSGDCWTPIEAYAELWDSINGEGSWNSDPWVWALTFTALAGNIDTLLKHAGMPACAQP